MRSLLIISLLAASLAPGFDMKPGYPPMIDWMVPGQTHIQPVPSPVVPVHPHPRFVPPYRPGPGDPLFTPRGIGRPGTPLFRNHSR